MRDKSRYNTGIIHSIMLAVVVAAVFLAAAAPSFVATSAGAKKLPVYSVQRDDKCVSLTFDAAWGDVILRHG